MKYAADSLPKVAKRQIVKAIRETATMDSHGDIRECPLCLLSSGRGVNGTDCPWCDKNIFPALGSNEGCDKYSPGKDFRVFEDFDGSTELESDPQWFAAKRRHLMRRARVLEKRWGVK